MAAEAAEAALPAKWALLVAAAAGTALGCTRAGHLALLVGLGLLYPLHAGLRGLRRGEEQRWLGYWLLAAALLWARAAFRPARWLPALDGLPEATLLAALYTPPARGLDVVMEVALLPMVQMMGLNREKPPMLDLPSCPSTESLPVRSPGSPAATPPRAGAASLKREQRSAPPPL